MKQHISIFSSIAPVPRVTALPALFFAALFALPIYAILILLSWLV